MKVPRSRQKSNSEPIVCDFRFQRSGLGAYVRCWGTTGIVVSYGPRSEKQKQKGALNLNLALLSLKPKGFRV